VNAEVIQSSSPRIKRTNLLALGVCGLLLAIFVYTAMSAVSGKSATFDEPIHLSGAWYQKHGLDFHNNPEDPALWKYYVVAGVNGDDPGGRPAWHNYLRPGRERMIWLGAVLGALLAWWTWRLSRSTLAAVVALAAFALDPNFLAHSPLVKNDVPISMLFLAQMATVWMVGQRVTVVGFVILALLLGAAMTTKFSGLVAIPIIAAALGIRALLPRSWPIGRWNVSRVLGRLAVAAIIWAGTCLIAYGIIWATYAFRFAPYPDGRELNFTTAVDMLSQREAVLAHGAPTDATLAEAREWATRVPPDRSVRVVGWMNEHHLIPQAWLYGYLYTHATTQLRTAFLCGLTSGDGWWYYFPLAMLFKTPLATLAAIFLAGGWGIRQVIRWTNLDPWSVSAVAIFPVCYMVAAMHSNLNLGIRHVLPVYPFLFILIGIAAARSWQRWPKTVGTLLGILLLGLAVETAAAYPDFIAFFNAAAGGERGGFQLLADSNLDWGQDLPALAGWQRDHPDRQLYLCYFGLADPRTFGIAYVNLPGSFAPADLPRVPSHIQPAVAISATVLQGVANTNIDDSYYDPFRQMQPIAVLGGSIYIFNFPRQWMEMRESRE